jgi:hypothetical protein
MRGLPTLFSRLGDDVMQLFNSQLALFKVEIKEEASAYARGVTMIAVGAVIATIGFALLNVAIAFAVSTLFAQANFSQPGQLRSRFRRNRRFLCFGGRDRRDADEEPAAKQDLVPQRTVAELRKDKQWLKNEL